MITKFKVFESKIKPKFKVGDFVYSIYDYNYDRIKNNTKYEISNVIFVNPKIKKGIVIKNDNYLPHFVYFLKNVDGSYNEKIFQSEVEYSANKYNL